MAIAAASTVGALLLAAGPNVLGFSLAPKPPRIPSTLSVATIDAAELFDGSFFAGADDSDSSADAIVGVGTSASASGGVAAERITSSGFAWAAIGAVLSLSAAINTQAVASSLRLLENFCSWYMASLEAAPLITKCLTGGIVALLGDYGAQWFEHRSRRGSKAMQPVDRAMSLRAGADVPFLIRGAYDRRRGMARFIECLLISTPLMHFGYDLFESLLPVVAGAGILRRSFAALTHVLADSLFLDAIFVCTGIIATGLFEGHSLRRHVLPNLRSVYFPTLKASVATSGALMPIEFLSFLVLPVQLRVLSVNVVDLIWTGVVSFVSHSGNVEEAYS
ncbi:hypothetical protein ACHAXT_011678 [Thalassiosira profunda]